MEKYPAVTIEKWLTDGWKLYKRNGLTFSFASVLAALICIPTSFIFFSGPLYAGLHYMALKSMRGGRPRIRDIFKGFKRYWGTFFLWLISSALTVLLISTGIGILFLPLLWAISMLAFPLLIDQGQDVEGTFHKAFKAVFTWRWKDWRGALKNWRRFWLFGLALPFIASIGVLGCFVGIFITIPLVVCAQATAYRDIFKTDAAFQLNARDLDPISRLSELRDWIFEEIDSANESIKRMLKRSIVHIDTAFRKAADLVTHLQKVQDYLEATDVQKLHAEKAAITAKLAEAPNATVYSQYKEALNVIEARIENHEKLEDVAAQVNAELTTIRVSLGNTLDQIIQIKATEISNAPFESDDASEALRDLNIEMEALLSSLDEVAEIRLVPADKETIG